MRTCYCDALPFPGVCAPCLEKIADEFKDRGTDEDYEQDMGNEDDRAS